MAFEGLHKRHILSVQHLTSGLTPRTTPIAATRTGLVCLYSMDEAVDVPRLCAISRGCPSVVADVLFVPVRRRTLRPDVTYCLRTLRLGTGALLRDATPNQGVLRIPLSARHVHAKPTLNTHILRRALDFIAFMWLQARSPPQALEGTTRSSPRSTQGSIGKLR